MLKLKAKITDMENDVRTISKNLLKKKIKHFTIIIFCKQVSFLIINNITISFTVDYSLHPLQKKIMLKILHFLYAQ